MSIGKAHNFSCLHYLLSRWMVFSCICILDLYAFWTMTVCYTDNFLYVFFFVYDVIFFICVSEVRSPLCTSILYSIKLTFKKKKVKQCKIQSQRVGTSSWSHLHCIAGLLPWIDENSFCSEGRDRGLATQYPNRWIPEKKQRGPCTFPIPLKALPAAKHCS